MAMTCLPRSSATSWPFTIIVNPQVFHQRVTDVVHPSGFSMAWIVPMTTYGTMTPDWLIWHGARGVWENGRVAFFDNHIVDADTPSYMNISWEAVANRASNAKKTKYNPAAEELRGTFTPLVCSTDGVLHLEYRAYHGQIRLASKLATKWQIPYSVVMNWVKLRMQFAVFCAVDLRLRGTRQRIFGLGLQDGAAIFAHRHWH